MIRRPPRSTPFPTRRSSDLGAADLALVEPDRVDHALHHTVEVGVVEHHEWRFAAQLERDLLAAAGGGLANDPPDLGRAGEGDLVDRKSTRLNSSHANISYAV